MNTLELSRHLVKISSLDNERHPLELLIGILIASGTTQFGLGVSRSVFVFFWALRGHTVIAIAAILGQILWIADLGSSNFFDHVSHVLLIPVIITCIFANWLRKRKPVYLIVDD